MHSALTPARHQSLAARHAADALLQPRSFGFAGSHQHCTAGDKGMIRLRSIAYTHVYLSQPHHHVLCSVAPGGGEVRIPSNNSRLHRVFAFSVTVFASHRVFHWASALSLVACSTVSGTCLNGHCLTSFQTAVLSSLLGLLLEVWTVSPVDAHVCQSVACKSSCSDMIVCSFSLDLTQLLYVSRDRATKTHLRGRQRKTRVRIPDSSTLFF